MKNGVGPEVKHESFTPSRRNRHPNDTNNTTDDYPIFHHTQVLIQLSLKAYGWIRHVSWPEGVRYYSKHNTQEQYIIISDLQFLHSEM